MSKHTPGPWEIWPFKHAGAYSVSPVGKTDAEDVVADKIHNESNARLIAAAPELLEALRETLESLRVWQEQYDPDATDEVTDQTIRRGSLAIARAEGKG